MTKKRKQPDKWASIFCENAILGLVVILIHLAIKHPILSIPVMVIAFGLVLAWDGGSYLIEGDTQDE